MRKAPQRCGVLPIVRTAVQYGENDLKYSPTKIRVYGSKRMTDRNVGVQNARRRGGVKVVSMKLPVLLQAARILRISRIMLAGLKD